MTGIPEGIMNQDSTYENKVLCMTQMFFCRNRFDATAEACGDIMHTLRQRASRSRPADRRHTNFKMGKWVLWQIFTYATILLRR
jgi:hypothetical protein